MTQLILDTSGENMVLPETRKNGYIADKIPLSVSLEMANGRMVREEKGFIWSISYQYGWFGDIDKDKFIRICEKGQSTPINCIFLDPLGNTTRTGVFWVDTYQRPKFQWSREGNALWGDYQITLREVKPNA